MESDCDIDFVDFDFVDFVVLGGQWLQPSGEAFTNIAPPGGDGIVDVKDLSLLAESWL